MALKTVLLIAAIAVYAGAAQAQGPAVDGSFATGSVQWRGDGAGTFRIAWKPFVQSDGSIAVCGAWSLNNPLMRSGAMRMLRRGGFEADGQVVATGMTAFKRHRGGRGALDGAPTGCIATSARPPIGTIDIFLGDGDVRN